MMHNDVKLCAIMLGMVFAAIPVQATRAAEPESPDDSFMNLAGSTRTEVPAVSNFVAEVFVSTTGNDDNTGSRMNPFSTLIRARDEVRAIKKRGLKGAIAVTVLPGQYRLIDSLKLDAEDSGDALGPIVYRAQENGTVVFYGGEYLTGFEPVHDAEIAERLPAEARDHVRQCNLKALGILDYGELKVRGFAQPPSPPTVELFVDGEAMTLARWPNEGFVGIDELVSPGSKATDEPSVFKYKSDRHARWTHASDGWLFGYFQFLWADATIKIGTIDPAAKTLSTAEPYHYNDRGMSNHQGIQYYAFNLLEEIDRPGEWYLDRQTGMLYLYTALDPNQSRIEIGMLSKPMITMDSVSHVRIEGLGFDLARYNGIEAKNCSHCSIIGCAVSRMAGNGIMIRGGRENQLIGCEVHAIGRTAMEVVGGDRETLTPGRHLVENCRIYNFGRVDRTYTPAINLGGVGNRVAHNLMYDGPSSAIRVSGNDHLIEYNEIHSMAQESDDQGAIDMYGNPTYRGIIFRYNYFHHIGKTGTETFVHGQAGIRFDDAISGMVVYGNIFYRSAHGNFGAIQMNGGRDNLIENNIFIDCKQGISGGWYPLNKIWKSMREGKTRGGVYQNELYLARYPKIATMMDPPGRNHVWRNVFYRCEMVYRSPSNVDSFDPTLVEQVENGVFEEDPGFVDYQKRDFRLRKDAKLFDTMNFTPIPFEQIGTYEAPFRK